MSGPAPARFRHARSATSSGLASSWLRRPRRTSSSHRRSSSSINDRRPSRPAGDPMSRSISLARSWTLRSMRASGASTSPVPVIVHPRPTGWSRSGPPSGRSAPCRSFGARCSSRAVTAAVLGSTSARGRGAASRCTRSISFRNGRCSGDDIAADVTGSSSSARARVRSARPRDDFGERPMTGSSRAGSIPCSAREPRVRTSRCRPVTEAADVTRTTSADLVRCRARRLRSSTSTEPVNPSPSTSASTSATTTE